MRAALVLIHRYGGLAIAPFLIVAGLTGSALAFMPELDVWLNPRLFSVSEAGAARSLTSLVSEVEAHRPELKVSAVLMPDHPARSLSMFVQTRPDFPPLDNDQLFVDPATGQVLGERYYGAFRPDSAHVMPFLRRVHYSLHIPGVVGIWFMGAVALMWMADCFAGFALTLPRTKPFWRKWKSIWQIKKRAGSFRRYLDVHRTSGLWFWPILFLLALSSVALNLPDQVFRPVLSRMMPTSPTIWEQPFVSPEKGAGIGFAEALAAAERHSRARGWRQRPAALFLLSDRGQYLVIFDGNRRPGWGASSLLVDARVGRIVHVEEAGSGKPGDKIANLMLPIHTGDVAGLPGRILICVTGLMIALLSVTGIYVWWKKRAPRVARRRVKHPHRSSRPLTGGTYIAD